MTGDRNIWFRTSHGENRGLVQVADVEIAR